MTGKSGLAHTSKQSIEERSALIDCKMTSSDEYEIERQQAITNETDSKSSMCYSIIQTEVLQTLGNYTFATTFEADATLQKVTFLMKQLSVTNISRLPAP